MPDQRQPPRRQVLESNKAAVLEMLARGASTRVVANAFKCRQGSVVAFMQRHAGELEALRVAVAEETRRQTVDDAVPDKAERLRFSTKLLRKAEEFVDDHQGLTTEIVRDSDGKTRVTRRFQSRLVDSAVKLMQLIRDETGDGSIAPVWTNIHMTVQDRPPPSTEERRPRIIE